MPYQVYIGGIPTDTRERDIEKLCDRYGSIDFVSMKNGFCFCYFKDKADAQYAIDKLDGTKFEGRRIQVEFALPKGERRDRERDRYREREPPRSFKDDHRPRGVTGGSEPQKKPGDWYCPKSECGSLNFARRTRCHLCGCSPPRHHRRYEDRLSGDRDNSEEQKKRKRSRSGSSRSRSAQRKRRSHSQEKEHENEKDRSVDAGHVEEDKGAHSEGDEEGGSHVHKDSDADSTHGDDKE